MLSKSKGSYVSVLQSPKVFTKTMVQGPTYLANVGAGAFSTWDAVHYTFPAIGWYWVLGVHSSTATVSVYLCTLILCLAVTFYMFDVNKWSPLTLVWTQPHFLLPFYKARPEVELGTRLAHTELQTTS